MEKIYNLGYKIGIISNGELNQQIKKMEKTNILKYISSIITSSEYNFSKPDIRIFEVACKNNNINYNEMIYIGDNYKNDIVPCIKLGIKSFWINRNNKLIDSCLENEIKSLDELISYLENNKKEKRYCKNEK